MREGRTLYLECTSGISGDMTVAALLDLGADEKVLRDALASLPLEGFQIQISRVKKSGLDACDFAVILDAEHENHDHDMEYLHGHPAAHTHGEEQPYHHAEDPNHSHGAGHHHRGLEEIRGILRGAALTDRAREIAEKVFDILAGAEAQAHGVPPEQVHFHEVGAVDSIVDIVSAAVCLDNLNIADVIVRELWEGRGTVRCQHGVIPVPVPAVLNIAASEGLTLHITDVQGELVTPTGAAIAAAVRTLDRLPGSFQVERVGIGAGKRQYDCPGILRAMFICGGEGQDKVCKLETNIDDSTGEMLGYAMKRLLEEGARDVFCVPIYMKKNRPACLLSVICMEEDRRRLEKVIFQETTTIGIRRQYLERSVLAREIRRVETSLGEAVVKVCSFEGETWCYPEYETTVQLARLNGISYRQASELIIAEASEQTKKA